MALAGASVRSVHAGSDARAGAARNSVSSFAALIDLVIVVVLESDTNASGDSAGPRIVKIVDTTRGETGLGVDLRIIPGIVGDQEQIVAREVNSRTPCCPEERQPVEGIAECGVLQTYERSVLDPARRVGLLLGDTDAVVESRFEEILALPRVALGGIDERGVVKHIESLLAIDQEAEVEFAPVHQTAKAESPVRVGIPDDSVVGCAQWDRHHTADTLRIRSPRRGTCKLLAPLGVYTHELWSEERAERLARKDSLGLVAGLTLPADAAGSDKGVGAELVSVSRKDESSVPIELRPVHNQRVEGELDTLVGHGPYVLESAGHDCRLRDRDLEYEVTGFLDIV